MQVDLLPPATWPEHGSQGARPEAPPVCCPHF
jgi:hypothetical protein